MLILSNVVFLQGFKWGLDPDENAGGFEAICRSSRRIYGSESKFKFQIFKETSSGVADDRDVIQWPFIDLIPSQAFHAIRRFYKSFRRRPVAGSSAN